MALHGITAADRLRGCVFAPDLSSAAGIAGDGGTITGSPTYDSERGIGLTGTQYVTYPASVTGQPFSSGFWSAVIEFWPTFEANDNLDHALFSTESALTYVWKYNDNRILIKTGNGTNVAAIALAAYQAYWKTNQRNVLVVCTRSGYTVVWLNGYQIGTGATAWAAVASGYLIVGAIAGGTAKFSGSITSIRFYRHASASGLFTAQEAADAYNRATYTYQSRATCILPMGVAQHDAAGARTLDVSGKGNHFTFGDGVTGSTFPTKLTTRGYRFDGGDWIRSSLFMVSTLPKYTMVIMGKRNGVGYGFGAGENPASPLLAYRVAIAHLGINNNLFMASCNGSTSDTVNETTGYLKAVNYECLAYVYDGSVSSPLSRLLGYLNGKQVTTWTYNGTIPASQAGINGIMNIGRISRSADGTWEYTSGTINYFAVYPFALTPTQVANEYYTALTNSRLT